MKILMIGGTGQSGYYALRHLSGQGYPLAAVGLEPEAPAGCLPAGVAYIHANIEESTHTGLLQLLTRADVVIHAPGTNCRYEFPHPATEGYRKANVPPFHPLIKAMLTARCSKLVVPGSYYTAMHRIYPRLRQEQQELVMQPAGSSKEVVVLELPYIFGVAPGKKPLWNFITDTLNTKKNPCLCTGAAQPVSPSTRQVWQQPKPQQPLRAT